MEAEIGLSVGERERLVVLFRKEAVAARTRGETPPHSPEVMAALMENNTPAVARKWLEDECLLDEQKPFEAIGGPPGFGRAAWGVPQ